MVDVKEGGYQAYTDRIVVCSILRCTHLIITPHHSQSLSCYHAWDDRSGETRSQFATVQTLLHLNPLKYNPMSTEIEKGRGRIGDVNDEGGTTTPGFISPTETSKHAKPPIKTRSSADCTLAA